MTPANTLRVPGSSANLGPGFDSLAIALKVYLECRFSVSNRLSIRVTGRDAHLIPATEENLIWKTALAVAARSHLPLPPIHLTINNDIPLASSITSPSDRTTRWIVVWRAAGARPSGTPAAPGFASWRPPRV